MASINSINGSFNWARFSLNFSKTTEATDAACGPNLLRSPLAKAVKFLAANAAQFMFASEPRI
jgi:hypothetical protein